MADTRPGADPLIGRTIDEKITVESVIGTGGMGRVFRAHHNVFGKDVAVKVLSAAAMGDANAVLRFKAEASALKALDHPNIVKVFSFGLLDEGTPRSTPYLVLEFLEGGALDNKLKPGNCLPLDECWRYLSQLSDGIAAAHQQQIIHRDLKPSNIMFAGDKLKIVDFGLAKAIAETSSQKLTQTGALLGTPRYMSPEQLSGQPPGPASDIYSIGCILYEMLYGKQLAEGESIVEIAMSKMVEPEAVPKKAPSGVEIPAGLRALLEKMLANDPAKRIADGPELARWVDVVHNAPNSIPPELAGATKGKHKTRASSAHKRTAVAVALLLAVLAGGTIVWLSERNRTVARLTEELLACTERIQSSEPDARNQASWEQALSIIDEARREHNSKLDWQANLLLKKMADRIARKQAFELPLNVQILEAGLALPISADGAAESAKWKSERVGYAALIIEGATRLASQTEKNDDYLDTALKYAQTLPALVSQAPLDQCLKEKQTLLLPEATTSISKLANLCMTKMQTAKSETQRKTEAKKAFHFAEIGVNLCNTYPQIMMLGEEKQRIPGLTLRQLADHYLFLLYYLSPEDAKKLAYKFLSDIKTSGSAPMWQEKLAPYKDMVPDFWLASILVEYPPEEYEKSLAILLKIERRLSPNYDKRERQSVKISQANIYNQLRQFDKARDAFTEAAKLAMSHNPPDYSGAASCDLSLTQVLLQLGDRENARKAYNQAVNIYRDHNLVVIPESAQVMDTLQPNLK